MKIMTLEDLYLDQIQDLHSCERLLIKAIPKMVNAAHHADLKAMFNHHLVECKGHLDRLNVILTGLGKTHGTKVCSATVGLVEESQELIDAKADESVRDAGLICAAQKVAHYQIASYGCLRTFADRLGRHSDMKLHESTLREEQHADESLTRLAMNLINAKADAAVG